MYIFTFHIVKITRRVLFFSSKISMITNVILIVYNSSINNKLILRYLCFRHHIACFCYISPTKNNSKQPQRCFARYQHNNTLCKISSNYRYRKNPPKFGDTFFFSISHTPSVYLLNHTWETSLCREIKTLI